MSLSTIFEWSSFEDVGCGVMIFHVCTFRGARYKTIEVNLVDGEMALYDFQDNKVATHAITYKVE